MLTEPGIVRIISTRPRAVRDVQPMRGNARMMKREVLVVMAVALAFAPALIDDCPLHGAQTGKKTTRSSGGSS
jgi:hypothetical protein